MSTPDLFSDPIRRRKAVDFALAMAHNTPLEPGEWERTLLRQFESGDLTLDEVEALLEALPCTHV
jgi:hypothetical protein